MSSVLIVEDQPGDMRVAAEVAQSVGYSDLIAKTNSAAARAYLEAAMQNQERLPDVIVLDLLLGYDSGHEILRFWHANQHRLKSRMVVWTVLGQEQQEICRLFNVDAVISKWEGAEALKNALRTPAAKAG